MSVLGQLDLPVFDGSFRVYVSYRLQADCSADRFRALLTKEIDIARMRPLANDMHALYNFPFFF